MTDIDKIVAEARHQIKRMTEEGNVKGGWGKDFYMPSDESMDAIIKSACEKGLKAQQQDTERLREILKRYMVAMDGIYNHNAVSRAAVVQYFGTLHDREAFALLEADAAMKREGK